MPRRVILPYDPGLKSRARELRANMTLSEVLLWQRMKRRQLGVDFDRQVPILHWIVDFFAKDIRLAIEIDGRSHDHKEAADLRRQREIEALGVRFLRFWDSDVKKAPDYVAEQIRDWIEKDRGGGEGD